MANKTFFILLLTIISCKEKRQNIDEVKITLQKPVKIESRKSEKVQNSSEWNFMKVNIESFPVSEKTSFDTYDNFHRTNSPVARVYRRLTKEQIKKLGNLNLRKGGNGEITNVSINYELPYSQNFKTFVFTYQDGEMELNTFMITFDKKYNLIDKLQIAYDEIAESWLMTNSKIYKNKS